MVVLLPANPLSGSPTNGTLSLLLILLTPRSKINGAATINQLP